MSCKHKFSYTVGHKVYNTDNCVGCNATKEEVEKENEKAQEEIDKFRRKIMKGTI